MQPVRIGINAAIVLLLLLISVPLQLLLTNVVTVSSNQESNEKDTRADAINRLVDTAQAASDFFYSTISYYSTWNHLKELVLVPYRKPSASKLKSTVFKTKSGTTAILISSTDGKSSKTSKTSKTGSQTGEKLQADAGKETGKTGSPSSTVTQSKTTTQKQSGASSTVSPTSKKATVIEEVSHAKEVEEYLMKEVYYSQSKKPRERRPSSLKFSVGQVVRHKDSGYVGVVIGWDEVAKAPEKWLQRYYSERKGVELTAHYLVLVDSKYSASGSPYHYVPQEDIELAPGEQIRCPEKSKYFEGFKNGRHIPKPWLQNRYPRD